MAEIKHDTVGRIRLNQLGKGPSELHAELVAVVPGMELDISTVSRWRSGSIRPEAFWRAAMARAWGIPETEWLTAEEQAALSKKGAS